MYVKMQNERDNLTRSNEVWRRIQLAMIYGSIVSVPEDRIERLLDELDVTVSNTQSRHDPYGLHWSTERNLQGCYMDCE
jgi:hypothetical protein